MATVPLINGIAHAWANIDIRLNGVLIDGITGIKYKKTQSKTNNKGARGAIVSRGYGSFDFEGSITLMSEELLKLRKAAGGDILSIAPFTITASFLPSDNTNVTVDKLLYCEFTEDGIDVKEGDTMVSVELPLIIGDIKFNAKS